MPLKAGLYNTERPIKCELGHVTSPNLLGDVMLPISRHWPIFKSFWLVDLKTALYKGQTREQILRKSGLYYIDYWLKTLYHEKFLTTRQSIYIELIYRKKISKGLRQNKQLEKGPKASKSVQNRYFERRFQEN